MPARAQAMRWAAAGGSQKGKTSPKMCLPGVEIVPSPYESISHATTACKLPCIISVEVGGLQDPPVFQYLIMGFVSSVVNYSFQESLANRYHIVKE